MDARRILSVLDGLIGGDEAHVLPRAAGRVS
jgi:hypothetical protein